MSSQPEDGTNPGFTLCEQCGFDRTAIQDRLQQMNLGDIDRDMAHTVRDKIIEPQHEQIMDAFYEFVFSQEYMQPFIGSEKNIPGLKQTQTEYLLSLGIGFDTSEYFEHRLRIGIAHARIEMPMNIYIAAYSKMQCLLHEAVRNSSIDDHDLLMACHQFINKIVFLDISLATDAYNFATLNNLSESVSQLKKEKNKLSNQLMHDALTGSLSRAYIMDVLDKHVAKHSRANSQNLSVALFDIDHFKNVNDTYGHQVGDALLVKFVETINFAIRTQDYLGRYGGEEFLFLVTDTSPKKIYNLVERIRKSIEKTVYNISGYDITMTISIGLAHIRPGDDTESIIQRADEALYQAKNSGRNQTVESK